MANQSSLLILCPKIPVIQFHQIAGANGMSSKVTIIARLDFEPTYFEDAIQNVNHYTTEDCPIRI